MNPGPGSYDTGIKRPSSGVKIGKAGREGFNGTQTPGPGSYGYEYMSGGGTKIGTSKRG